MASTISPSTGAKISDAALTDLDHADLVALFEAVAGVLLFDEDDLAQLLCGVGRDADGRDIAVDGNPLVVVRKIGRHDGRLRTQRL